MATPSGPATPGNPISFDDLRVQPYITPNTDIGLYLMGAYTFDDGFLDSYTFYQNYYPLPSSPAGGILSSNLSISYFYDINTDTGTDCYFSSGAPAWVTDVSVTVSNSTSLASGSNNGANHATSPQTIRPNGQGYGTYGGNIEHWYSMDISVNVTGNPPPSPPFPPSTPVNVEYRLGTGPWTAFPGTPTNQPNPNPAVQNIHIANGDILYVQVY